MNTLETGDILLFHGEGFWFSSLVEWVTGSQFSHVAMVLRDPIDLDPSLKGLYMIESGEERFPDAIKHRVTKGVQIVDLIEVIKTYTGTIYYRRFIFSEKDRAVELKHRITMELLLSREIWPKIKDCPYDDNPWDLVKVAFNIKWGNNCRTNCYFCSALICFLLESFSLLRVPVDWDLIQPRDFDDNARIEKLLTVLIRPKQKLSSNLHIF